MEEKEKLIKEWKLLREQGFEILHNDNLDSMYKIEETNRIIKRIKEIQNMLEKIC